MPQTEAATDEKAAPTDRVADTQAKQPAPSAPGPSAATGRRIVVRREKATAGDARLQAKAAGDFGEIDGYAAVFGVVDLQREIVRKGAFTKTIAETDGIPLMARHAAHGGAVAEVVGKTVELVEDDHGLWFRAVLLPGELAQHTREAVRIGAVKYASIGYRTIRSRGMSGRRDGAKRQLIELELLEITLTIVPAQPLARVSAKSQEGVVRIMGTPKVSIRRGRKKRRSHSTRRRR